jgi:hypothetical protein
MGAHATIDGLGLEGGVERGAISSVDRPGAHGARVHEWLRLRAAVTPGPACEPLGQVQ